MWARQDLNREALLRNVKPLIKLAGEEPLKES